MQNISNYKININSNKSLAIEHFNLLIQIFSSLNMDYWIEYGTMLGAVREKGFITWDSEFDVGIWDADYQKNKEKLFEAFTKAGFHINTNSKDRVKLLHKDLLIGAYTLDIHTYHLSNDTAFVSYNRREKSLKERCNIFLKNYDRRIIKNLPISSLIKSILKSGNSLPEEFYLTIYPYGGKNLYKICFGDVVITQKRNNYSVFKYASGRIMDVLFKIVPQKIIQKLVDKFTKEINSDPNLFTNVQAIPSHFYTNLENWPFETTYLKGPKEGVEYVEHIYGSDWHIGKSNWTSTQNNINKDISYVK